MPQRHRVFVTGGSGFVGHEVIAHLLARGASVVALTRRPGAVAEQPGVAVAAGDLTGDDRWKSALAGCDAVIHLVGIIREDPAKGITFAESHVTATHKLCLAAWDAGVKRFVHMSALGTRPGAVSTYHRSKWQGEEEVRKAGLSWTIFRPSVIHGPRGEFTRMLYKWAGSRPRLMPYFGGGALGRRCTSVQPVYVGDVARAFVESLDCPASIGRVYDIAGPQSLTWPGFYREITAAWGIGRVRPLAVPAWFARGVNCVVPQRFLPFTRDQVIMAGEQQQAEVDFLEADFGWSPQSLAASARAYADELRSAV